MTTGTRHEVEGHDLTQLLKLNIMWDKILKCIQVIVGTGSLFGAHY